MRKNSNETELSRSEKARLAAYFRGRLLERRSQALQRLRHELESLDQAPTGGSGDFADMASSSVDRETFCGISAVESDAVSRIDHALRRIDEGTYGLCEECGGRIPQARLRILPFASLCVACKQREELEGEMGEAPAAAWNDADEYESEEPAGAFVLRGNRPGG